jgi:hypothetical protein
VLERRVPEQGPDISKLIELRRKYDPASESKKVEQFHTAPWARHSTTAEFLEYWRRALASPRYREVARSEISNEVSVVGNKINDLASSMEAVKQDLALCKETIDKLREELGERPVIKQTKLFDIDEKLDVIQPIPIVIEQWSDEVIASFPEVEVFAVGSSEPEAISNLKTAIGDLYYDLIETPKDKLGRLPMSWLRILEKVLRKVGDA